MTDFKAGDRVHLELSPDIKGVIVEINLCWSYPIRVRWDDKYRNGSVESGGTCYGWNRLRIIPAVDRLADLANEGR